MTGSETQDKLSTTKKLCYGLQSPDRKLRKQTFIDLEGFLRKTDFSHVELRNMFSETQMYTLSGLRDKTEAVREQAIKFLTFLIIELLPINDYYLTYVFPVLVERIGSVELVEESEEIRLELVQFLQAIIRKYAKTEQLKPFLNDMVIILAETAKDKHPAIKELTCRVIIELSEALPKDFHMQAETLIKPVLTSCFSHQRYKVRVEAIKCIGEIIMNSSYKALEEAVGPLAEKLFDQIPMVRRAVAQVAARLMLDYRDRYSFFHKLLPLLMTGLNDEVLETREEAHALWRKVGLQFEKENEKDLKDYQFLAKDDVDKPTIGCRELVKRNVGKLTGAVSRELLSWQEDVRVRCSQLLCALALHAEGNLIMHLNDLLPAIYSAARDDDRRVVDNIERACEIIGQLDHEATWVKLVLPVITGDIHYGYLATLGFLIKGSSSEDIEGFIGEISQTLADDLICYRRHSKYQLQLMFCIKALSEKFKNQKGDYPTEYNFFKIALALISLKHQDNAELINISLLNDLAQNLGINPINLWYSHTNPLLNHVNTDPKLWTEVTDSACIFWTILMESHEAFGRNLDIIGEILTEALDYDAKPESRLKTFWALSTAFENKDIIFADCSNENCATFLSKLIRDVFVPSLVWHAGASAEVIRTMAAACLKQALLPQGDVHLELFATGEELKMLFDELLPLLLSLVEDASYKSRQLSMECLTLLKDNCCRKSVWELEYLLKIYPEVMKRLDDPTDKVRLMALSSLREIFKEPPHEFVGPTFGAHHELIIDTLLTHFDDDDDVVQGLVFEILKVVAEINRVELRKKIEGHKSLLRNQAGCSNILQYLD